jgi:phosphoglycolate phosphatase-like HAD superfamily hydrolase
MREAELVLLGAVQPKDYVLDAIVVPKNSIVIIDGEKHVKCGVVSENNYVVSNDYMIENVSETPCPTYKELAEMAIHLKALDYRLNSFTYKYDLMVVTLLKKHGLIQLE